MSASGAWTEARRCRLDSWKERPVTRQREAFCSRVNAQDTPVRVPPAIRPPGEGKPFPRPPRSNLELSLDCSLTLEPPPRPLTLRDPTGHRFTAARRGPGKNTTAPSAADTKQGAGNQALIQKDTQATESSTFTGNTGKEAPRASSYCNRPSGDNARPHGSLRPRRVRRSPPYEQADYYREGVRPSGPVYSQASRGRAQGPRTTVTANPQPSRDTLARFIRSLVGYSLVSKLEIS
ncbi:hypothetical protein NDU88_007205 [Pleurodeles waltl]|uniref:Uncharacterized protein n=1 Tax=Pleurodeles waltl TaxID=8319 RepID=A0AAV7NVK1_PLEWA|nr:hypothetical protein NDU88_007205 [Pleurodeles waltl]